ncbi:hypothetical protein EBR43_10730 [bacterium]|nr:hypothetical protein [bacterium]
MNEEQLPDGAVIKEAGSIEENLPMVTYIMLHRIYDLLSLIANKVAGSEETAKMVGYHDQGYLLGPEPSYTPRDVQVGEE